MSGSVFHKRSIWACLIRLKDTVISFVATDQPERGIDSKLVRSTMVAAIGYFEEDQILRAEYRNGWVYDVNCVQPCVFEELINSENFDYSFRELILKRYDMFRVGKYSAVLGG